MTAPALVPASLEVWGDPIEHSLSPTLHAAAYSVLGLPWAYGRRRVSDADFDAELAVASGALRGISCTMPLKESARRAAVRVDRRAELTGAVNTLLLSRDEGPVGFNTDVGGLVNALGDEGIAHVSGAYLIGAGATAASALVALGELGVRDVTVFARNPARAASLVDLGRSLQIAMTVADLADPDLDSAPHADVTIGTLPGGAALPEATADRLAQRGGMLLDVAYAPWPSALALAWERAGGRAISGLSMLLHQALLQVRIFVGDDPTRPVEREPDVLASMRSALMGD